MFRFGSLAMLLLLSLPFAVLSGRVQVHRHKASGPHKCSIHWEVPGRGVAKTSFPVSSCRLQCIPTFTDNYYTKKFPAALSVEGDQGRCKCLQLDGTPVLRMHGNCKADDAGSRCFESYMRLRTNEYKREYGKETARVVPHTELFHESTFDYSVCEENACKDGNCIESVFPSIMEGRSEEEMALLADILKKYRETGTVDEGEKELIDHLTQQDRDAILGEEESFDDTHDVFDDVVKENEQETSGALTVARLKEIYNKKLQGTGISVPHLLRIAGLTDDSVEVDFDAFKRFLEPACDEDE